MTHPGLCPIAQETALAAPMLCSEYGPNGWMDSRHLSKQAFVLVEAPLNRSLASVDRLRRPMILIGMHHSACIDDKVVFDSVCRDSLWKLLRIYAVAHNLLKPVRLLYNYTSSGQLRRKLSNEYVIHSGVHHCCVLAPELFSTVIDHLMHCILA